MRYLSARFCAPESAVEWSGVAPEMWLLLSRSRGRFATAHVREVGPDRTVPTARLPVSSRKRSAATGQLGNQYPSPLIFTLGLPLPSPLCSLRRISSAENVR